MSNQSTARARTLTPEGHVERTLTIVRKPAKVQTPTGFYRRKGSDIWYFRRKIKGVLINVSTGFTLISEARQFADDLVQAQRYGDLGWVTGAAPTVKQSYDAQKPRHKHYRMDAFIEKYGKYRITAVTSEMCADWITERQKMTSRFGRPFQPGTVRVECLSLKAFFQRSVGPHKPLRENPWKDKDVIKLPKKSVRENILRKGNHQDRFFAGCLAVDPTGRLLRCAKTIIGSGLRIAEFVSLRPYDVREGTIYVRAEVAKGGHARPVPLQAETLAVVEEQRTLRGLDVFSTERLFDIGYIHLEESFAKACKLAGLTGELRLTPHDLRRTYGSRMAFLVPPKVLQALMGHRDFATTMAHYQFVYEDENATLVQATTGILG